MKQDTPAEPNVAILLTPLGAGAIAVVRLRGPRTADFLTAHFSKTAMPGRCVHGILSDAARAIDDPVVVLLPQSLGADINLHGGPWIVESVLELARRFGFAIVRSEVPTAIDAVDGESDIEREMLSHLPLASTELAVRVLLAQPTAWGDFDRLMDQLTGEDGSRAIQEILDDRALWHLLHPPRVAIVGATNVGKSTLANQLFARERSITADIAGTTRDWVGETANVNGLAVMLVDTPGIRETHDPIERAAIQQSRAQIAQAELVILVLDATRPLEPEQSALLTQFANALKVVNKSDRPHAWDAAKLDAIQTVATTGEGVDSLRRQIAAHFGCDEPDIKQMRWWTQRQRTLLEDRRTGFQPVT